MCWLKSSPAHKFGILSAGFERVFCGLTYISFVKLYFFCFYPTQLLNSSEEERLRRCRYVEWCVLLLIILEIVSFCFADTGDDFIAATLVVFAAWRLFDIFQNMINVAVLDHFRVKPSEPYLASATRSVLLGFVNFGEAIICFAVIYSSAISQFGLETNKFVGLYFSVITQLTVGYGDISPKGDIRVVAACQAMFGFVLSVALIGRLISLLPRWSGYVELDHPREQR
jgi:Ion channel